MVTILKNYLKITHSPAVCKPLPALPYTVDLDKSFFIFSFKAACAAASFAMGILYGEQLT
jgi:hypothetical protein